MKSTEKTFTVLLLSAPIGSGHVLAAQALEELLQQQPNTKVVHGNIFSFFPHILGQSFLRFYLLVLDCCPWLYELAYKWGNRQSGSLWLRSLLNGALAKLGDSYIKSVAPDAVIATHATPAGIMGIYKKTHPHLWLGAVVTDFTIHRWWLCEGVDTYFIADERLRSKIKLEKPVDVQAFGIPVRQQFLNNNGAACRAGYGWNDGRRVCLLMGGGEGLLPMEKIIAVLHKQQGLRLVAVTGRNEKLAERLRQAYPHLEIYGFRQDVPQMMSAADMIITKAGGLTAAEVLSCGLDFIIYKPLPGQEEGNAAFLHRHCGAHIAKNVTQLAEIVGGLCAAKAAADEKKPALGKPHAAEDICAYILKNAR